MPKTDGKSAGLIWYIQPELFMPILANTITIFFFLGAFYIFVLNIVIGVFEGLLLTRLFKATRFPILLMILANFASACAGMFLISGISQSALTDSILGNDPLPNLLLYSAVQTSISFVITVIVEWRLVYTTFKNPPTNNWHALLATITVNVLSYGLILLFSLLSPVKFYPFTPPNLPRFADRSTLGPLPPALLLWVDPSGCWLAADINHPERPIEIEQLTLSPQYRPCFTGLFLTDTDYEVRLAPWKAPFDPFGYNNEGTYSNKVTVTAILDQIPSLVGLHVSTKKAKVENVEMDLIDWRPENKDSISRPRDYSYSWYSSMIGAPDRLLIFEIPGDIEKRLHHPCILPDGKLLFTFGLDVVIYDPTRDRLFKLVKGDSSFVIPLKPAPFPATQPQ